MGGAEIDTSLRAWKITQPDGTSVTNEFEKTGLLKKTYGGRTYPIEYKYDAQGRMTNLITWQNFAGDSGRATTTWLYSSQRGWLEKKVYQGETDNTADYEYKASGRLWKRHWERDITTTYGYNAAGDLESVDYSDSTPDVAYTFDRRGQRATAAANGITTTFYRSETGQPLSEAYGGGTLGGSNVTNTYDALLRRSTVSPRNGTTALATHTYGYHTASGRLETVSDGTQSATYSYLANSPLVAQITFKQSSTTRMTTTKAYDFLNRLTSIGSSAVSFGYDYNSANQRIRATLADGSFWVYEYDALGQVKSGKRYWSDGTPVPGQQYEYAFDDIGNRTSTKAGGDQNGGSLRSAGYSPNLLNQYTSRSVPTAVDVVGAAYATASVTVNGSGADYRKGEYFQKMLSVTNSAGPAWTPVSVVATQGTSTTNTGNLLVAPTNQVFLHDADGNLTNDSVWVYTWNGENRLVKVESLASNPAASKRKVEWEYDAQGRRIRQTTYDGSSGSYAVTEDLKFLSDGWRHIAELNATNNALVRSYVWGLDLSGSMDGAGGVGGLLIVNSAANGPHFAAYDGNGNSVALVDASDGTVSANYEHGPFGEPLRVSGSMAKENPFRFSTKRTDNTTDLVLYEYRPYSASLGRWPLADPIGEQGHETLVTKQGNDFGTGRVIERGGPNLYGFVANNPVLFLDRDGREIYSYCPVCLAPKSPFGGHQCSGRPTGINFCVRDIDKSGAGCFNYCLLSVANIVGHGFLALRDEKGAIVDTRGSRFDWAGAGEGPWPEPQPVKPRACSRCIRTDAALKHGPGADSGKTGQTASESEIWECITKHSLTRHYGGLRYNCNDWAAEAADACGVRCPR
jgi:RHS repeat-associated protein